MSNHRQWVELDPSNGADAGAPQDTPASTVETAADQPVPGSAATQEPAPAAER